MEKPESDGTDALATYDGGIVRLRREISVASQTTCVASQLAGYFRTWQPPRLACRRPEAFMTALHMCKTELLAATRTRIFLELDR